MRREWTLHSEYEAEVDMALEDEDSFDSDISEDENELREIENDSFNHSSSHSVHYRTGLIHYYHYLSLEL